MSAHYPPNHTPEGANIPDILSSCSQSSSTASPAGDVHMFGCQLERNAIGSLACSGSEAECRVPLAFSIRQTIHEGEMPNECRHVVIMKG